MSLRVDSISAWIDGLAARLLKPLAGAAALGMWIVLIMGATVTNTGSQTGCGPSWPLCRGRFIPQMAVSTFIEFSHRTVVGLESILIIGLALAVWRLYPGQREIRFLALVMVLFLFLQAGLGAWAVMAPQEPTVLALHFGVSLVAFASVLLVAALVIDGRRLGAMRRRKPPSGFTPFIWLLLLGTYGVVYLGAYVRHIHADDACQGWPLCNGKPIPVLHGLVTPAFLHRLAALMLVIGVLALVVWAASIRARRPDLFAGSLLCLMLVVAQAGTGALVAATHLDLFSALAHAGVVALYFGALSCLALQTLPGALAEAVQRDAVRPSSEALAAGSLKP